MLEIERTILCCVFLDSWVGLTAADAEQLNVEAMLDKDAIGHTNEHKGELIFDWLVAMYELFGTTVDEVVCELVG